MILPFEHIRVFRRKGVIKPILTREPMGILDTLIEVYKDHTDKKRGILDSVVADCEYLGYDYKLVRGVAAVLDSRSVFQSKSAIPPIEARRQVFSLATETVVIGNEERLSVLSQIAEKNGITVEELDDSLYSDLEEEQYLLEFNGLTSEDLSLYYNYAHTVALLAYSTRIEMSYRGDDGYLERVFYGLGSEEPNRGSLKVVNLKSTNRLSQRASKFDDLLSRLLEKEGWLLRAEVKYPARYKSTCTFEIDSRGDGRLLKTDPVVEELIIEIPLTVGKKKPLKYGEIVVLDEVAERAGVTNGKILREIKDEGSEYKKLGGVLVVPAKYDEIKEALKAVETLGEAQSYFKSLGVRDFIQGLESFGYQIEWAKPRKSSKLYRF
jgi:predicted nuclease of restriction endonuclease-like RecB superfamily